jgi:hypothetical protein
MNPKTFVEMLADVRLPLVFNPYSDICPIYDRADAPERRRDNLEQFVRAAMDSRDVSVWIGRDLGYRGGRRTGIALTDEIHLDRLADVYPGNLLFRKATHGPMVTERTASVFWEMIGRLRTTVFTWNVFPFHPHLDDQPLTNRCHTRRERSQVAPILEELVRLIEPSQLIAIGNDAAAGLEDLGLRCLKVRHPSYGGIAEFRAGVASFHSLNDALDSSRQLNLI